MANQSAKKNEQNIKGRITFINYILYPIFILFLTLNIFYTVGESVTFWHLIWCSLVTAVSVLCIKQTVKCWELGLPAQASEYYIDILALNTLVAVFDHFTHKIWHLYWLLVVFVVVKLSQFLWDYITPKFEEVEEEGEGKKQKKEKKEKVKYIKA